MKLTPHGERLYTKARRVIEAAREAEAEVKRLDGVPRGLLRVSIPTGVPGGPFTEMVLSFMVKYPEVSVELVASEAHVDMVAEGFDVALRGGPIEDPSLVMRPLATNRRVAVASPRYLAMQGTPTRAEDLASHNCIVSYRAGVAPLALDDGVARKLWQVSEELTGVHYDLPAA